MIYVSKWAFKTTLVGQKLPNDCCTVAKNKLKSTLGIVGAVKKGKKKLIPLADCPEIYKESDQKYFLKIKNIYVFFWYKHWVRKRLMPHILDLKAD